MLKAQALADLRASGLGAEMISSMGCHSVDVSVHFKSLGVESIYRLPYYQLDGYAPFWRDKLIPPAVHPDGTRQKYNQPNDAGCRLYVLPQTVDALYDRTQPLFVVEAEKKTAAGVQHGLLAVGIGGLWNFKISGTMNLIPEFDSVPLDSREINLVPDNDVWTRPDLRQPVYELGMLFKNRGAHVYVVRLPDGSAKGLDDYFLTNNIEAFSKLDRYTLKHPVWTELREPFRQKVKMHQAADAKPVKEKVEVSAADAAEALKLLNDPALLATFLIDIADMGCVGENDNKCTVFLSCVSRLLKNPINITVKGESSAGKNYLVSSVVRFLPPENLHSISSATPKALFYLGEDLSNSVIVIAEAPGAEDASYSIRTLQSEGELTILVPEKKGERIETSERKVKGPVTFIETTTKTHLHAENETRAFDIFVDESESQTAAIFEIQNKKALGLINDTKANARLKLWQNAQRLLKPLSVQIPFASLIKFPTRPLRVRRDRPRFFALIEASALLHQYQRTTKAMGGIAHVVASLDDYETAVELSREVLGRVLTGITPKCEQMVTTIRDQLAGEDEFTVAQVMEVTGWSRDTTDKYLREARGVGCLEQTQGGTGRLHKYRFVKLAKQIEVRLPSREEIATFMEDKSS
jgi:hypothetical protein